ncbi:MAG: TRAP transporter fused permease subunit, partial [Negativicoccus succinicivorans]|nr:TRAP transporter fused permease subunit [Negativicoccus succinicivorans]
KAATIPAILYFLGIWLGVHFEARRENLQGLPRENLPKFGVIFRERGHLALPLVVIIGLLVSGYTPMRAALIGIFLTVAAAMLRKNTRLSFIEVVQGLIDGARNMLSVLAACAAAGIIIGVVTKTGIGLKMASALIDLSGGVFLAVLFFTMLTSLVLGMGVPTTANYVITSTIAAPALVQLGVPVLAAHMFVFYFGIVADVTPPVALAAYAGSAIAGGNALRTGVQASKLAIAAFLIPYIFVNSPAMLMIDTTIPKILMVLLTSIIGMVAISSAMIGHFVVKEKAWERILFIIGGLCMIDTGATTDIIGIVLLAVLFFLQWQRGRKQVNA